MLREQEDHHVHYYEARRRSFFRPIVLVVAVSCLVALLCNFAADDEAPVDTRYDALGLRFYRITPIQRPWRFYPINFKQVWRIFVPSSKRRR